MDKLKMQTPDLVDKNVEQIAKIFPEVITEIEDDDGKLKKGIDFDLLKQKLSDVLVEDENERYHLDWPGKKASLLKANTPITKTLRPVIEESVDFENTQNLYIEGDNFEVLKILQESYLGKVKMIYIDPPYNTGTSMLYNNDFSIGESEYIKELGSVTEDGVKMFKNADTDGRIHSNWLSFIYERILIARDLLTEDGIICATIDDYELPRMVMILDEIMGEENMLATIPIRNNPAGRSTAKGVSITHEYALLYGKSDKSMVNRLPRSKKQLDRYDEQDEEGRFEWVNFRKPGSKREESPKMYYPIFASKDSLRIPKTEWDSNKEDWILLEDPRTNEEIIYPIDDEGKKRRWRWAIHTLEKEISEVKPKILKGKIHIYLKGRLPNEGVLPNTWWDKKEYSSTAYGTNLMKKIFSELQIFTYPKSLFAVIDCLRIMSNNKNDIILDFFAGSATTAHAVIQMNAWDRGNRKFILAQLPEKADENSEAYKAGYKTISDIGKERIRRAGKKIKEEYLEKYQKELDKINKELEQESLEGNEDLESQKAELEAKIEHVKNLDTGFRVYKTDSSNMKDVYYHPTELAQDQLSALESNIKEDRSSEDLLTQVILDLGLELSLPIEKQKILGNTVFIVQQNALVA